MVLITLQNLLPEVLVIPSSVANTPKQARYIILEISLNFQASLVVDLVFTRNFHDAQAWHRCVGQYMSVWLNDAQAVTFADGLRMHYLAIDQVRLFLSNYSRFLNSLVY